MKSFTFKGNNVLLGGDVHGKTRMLHIRCSAPQTKHSSANCHYYFNHASHLRPRHVLCPLFASSDASCYFFSNTTPLITERGRTHKRRRSYAFFFLCSSRSNPLLIPLPLYQPALLKDDAETVFRADTLPTALLLFCP